MEKAHYKCPVDHVATRVPLLKQVTKIKRFGNIGFNNTFGLRCYMIFICYMFYLVYILRRFRIK